MHPDNKAHWKAKTSNKTPKPKQFEDTERASDADTAGMLGGSDLERESAMITVLRALVDKADTAGTARQGEQERGILKKN